MFTVQELIAVVEESILKSNNQESKITESILFLKGMSGSRCRHFLNNVCSSSGMNYLEIGAWEGSTSISALYLNPIQNYTVIDDWSAGPSDASLILSTNYVSLLGHQPNIIGEDCFSFDPLTRNINNIDVFFNDIGDTGYNQYQALTHYYDSMASNFIYIINTVHYPYLMTKTNEAITDKNLTKNQEWFVSISLDDPILEPNQINKLYIAVLSK